MGKGGPEKINFQNEIIKDQKNEIIEQEKKDAFNKFQEELNKFSSTLKAEINVNKTDKKIKSFKIEGTSLNISPDTKTNIKINGEPKASNEVSSDIMALKSNLSSFDASKITLKLYSGVLASDYKKLFTAVAAAGDKPKIEEAMKYVKALTTNPDSKLLGANQDGKPGINTFKAVCDKLGQTEIYYSVRTRIDKMENKPKNLINVNEKNNTFKDYIITMYGKSYPFKLNDTTIANLNLLKQYNNGFENIFWDIKNRFDYDTEGNLSDFPLKTDFIEKIKRYFEQDKWQDETDTEGKKYTKIEDYINEMSLNDLVAHLTEKLGIPKVVTPTPVEEDQTKDVKIETPAPTVETKDESTTKIGTKTFENYKKQIDDYISTISGIGLLSIPGAELISLNPLLPSPDKLINNNPYVYITESGTTNIIERINVNNYIKDGRLDINSLKKQIDFVKTRTENLKKTIDILRGKSYSAEEIFGKDNPLIKTDKYQTFFSYFENNKVLIDESPNYTFFNPVIGGYKVIQFDLNEIGHPDHGYCKGLGINVFGGKEINKDGTFNETEFKNSLAKKITAIIEDPKNEF